ncbi:MAG: ABC transporter ATP-binding protein [Chloroflexi bacterium]|nr:ABC transporter ATP-binding protein [Chloroflexota bacterium]
MRGVRVVYGDGGNALKAIDGLDLVVPSGGTLGLVGESGCGKSTLARAIVGLVPLVSGEVTLDGVDFTAQRRRDSLEFRRRVQMIFQDPYASLNPRMTTREMLDEALATRGVPSGSARRAEATHILDLVGLPLTALDRYPHQFSGGQRQRIAIARALGVGPDVIVSDEVTSALDVSVQATILNLLRDLQRDLKLSYLFISHDLSAVRAMSDVVAVMYLGRIVETAPTDAFFERAEHPYSRALIASVPRLWAPRAPAAISGELPDPRQPPSGCRFHTRCPIGPAASNDRQICIEVDPHLGATERRHASACHFAAMQTSVGSHELPSVDAFDRIPGSR